MRKIVRSFECRCLFLATYPPKGWKFGEWNYVKNIFANSRVNELPLKIAFSCFAVKHWCKILNSELNFNIATLSLNAFTKRKKRWGSSGGVMIYVFAPMFLLKLFTYSRTLTPYYWLPRVKVIRLYGICARFSCNL